MINVNYGEWLDGYEQGKAAAEREFQDSDAWNDYLAKVIADARTDAIEECKEVVRQHWINGTVAHRIAEEIYGDLEKLKEAK